MQLHYCTDCLLPLSFQKFTLYFLKCLKSLVEKYGTISFWRRPPKLCSRQPWFASTVVGKLKAIRHECLITFLAAPKWLCLQPASVRTLMLTYCCVSSSIPSLLFLVRRRWKIRTPGLFFDLWRRSCWVFVVWVRIEKGTVHGWQKLWNTGWCVKTCRRSDKWVYSKGFVTLRNITETLRNITETLPPLLNYLKISNAAPTPLLKVLEKTTNFLLRRRCVSI